MRKQKITKTEYVLEIQDIGLIKDCLNYCYHRIKKHNKFCKAHFDHIQELRKQFKII